MGNLMEYKGYHARVEYDADDKIFVGNVFGISDSLNFHGTNVNELEDMFHQSIENYLDLCEKIEKKPDKEFKGSFNVRISQELHKKVALEAEKENMTLNQYVKFSLEKSFEKPTIKEKVIYIPYNINDFSWENDNFYHYKLPAKHVSKKTEIVLVDAKSLGYEDEMDCI